MFTVSLFTSILKILEDDGDTRSNKNYAETDIYNTRWVTGTFTAKSNEASQYKLSTPARRIQLTFAVWHVNVGCCSSS